MSAINKLLRLIEKDNNDQNESSTVSIMLRFIYLFYGLFFVFCFVLSLIENDSTILSVFVFAMLGLSAFGFYRTYVDKSIFPLVLYYAMTTAWIAVSLVTYGWDCGAFEFTFVALIMFYVSTYFRLRIKVAISVVIALCYLSLKVISLNYTPLIEIDGLKSFVLQVMNVSLCFIHLNVVIITFSANSVRMVKKLQNYNISLKELSSIDPLTTLYNRRKMMEKLEESILEADDSNHAIGIVIGDIDFFKRFNDCYGHDCGDEVLKQLSALFKDYMEDKGFVARWGGEEFLFAFTDTSEMKTHDYMENLIQKIRLMSIVYGGEYLRVTMTFGVNMLKTTQSLDACITMADKKLYYGKQTGRNRIIYQLNDYL